MNPRAIFASTADKYSGRALSNMPMNRVYAFTVAVSRVIQGMLMIASTSGACILSSRDTTCAREANQRRISAVSIGESFCFFDDTFEIVGNRLN